MDSYSRNRKMSTNFRGNLYSRFRVVITKMSSAKYDFVKNIPKKEFWLKKQVSTVKINSVI